MADTWTVEIRRTAIGAPLVHMPYKSLMFSEGLNDVGGGSVTFDLDEALTGAVADESLWDEILERPNVWVIKRNGQVLSAFTADSVEASYASTQGSRDVTVSGKGLLAQLDYACVLPPNALSGIPYAPYENDGFYWSYGIDEFEYNGGSTLMVGTVNVWAGLTTVIYVEDDVFNADGQFYEIEIEDTDSLFHVVQGLRYGSDRLLVISAEDSFTAADQGTIRGLRVTTFHHFYKVMEQIQQRFAYDGEAFPSVLPEIQMGFTRFEDYKGAAWVQRVPDGSQENGVTLLSLLQTVSTGWQESASGTTATQDTCDFRIKFQDGVPMLLVARSLGTDRTATVAFHDMVAVEKSRKAERADIRNVVVARADGGTYPGSVVVASSKASRRDWGRRESLIATTGDEPKDTAAVTKLQAYSQQLSSWTVGVPPEIEVERSDGTTVVVNRVFEDYDVGDWIGVAVRVGGQRSVISLRVAAISAQVDAQGVLSVELTLDSIINLLRELADKTR